MLKLFFKLVILTSLFYYSSLLVASQFNEAAAIEYINTLRKQAGMTPLKHYSLLTKSAKNHATYLAKHHIQSHYQSKNKALFTGKTVKNRAYYVGYPASSVSENISHGNSTYRDSIDGLMSAIYHRLGFLDPSIDEIGVGRRISNQTPKRYLYVYNMGNSWQRKLCQTGSSNTYGRHYVKSCKNSKTKIKVETYDFQKQHRLKNNPSIILWPPANSHQIPPVFFEETPDPLPDYSVSGYPVSVQFNEHFFGQVKLIHFIIRDEQGNKITNTRLLTHTTDPNDDLKKSQFVLFPLNRLKWDSQYRVDIKYKHKSQTHRLQWTFNTTKPAHPLFTLKGHAETIGIKSGQSVLVYVPPTHGSASIGDINWSKPKRIKVKVSTAIDKNTVKLTINGQHCDTVKFKISNNRSFNVKLIRQTQTDKISNTPTNDFQECLKAPDTGLKTFTIHQNNQQLKTSSSDHFAVFLDPVFDNEGFGDMSWKYTKGMTIKIKRFNNQTIILTIKGKRNHLAKFKTASGKEFTVKIR